jgi:hypothetical protein
MLVYEIFRMAYIEQVSIFMLVGTAVFPLAKQWTVIPLQPNPLSEQSHLPKHGLASRLCKSIDDTTNDQTKSHIISL